MNFEQPLENDEEKLEEVENGVEQEEDQEEDDRSISCPDKALGIARQVAEEMGLEITIKPSEEEYKEMSDITLKSSSGKITLGKSKEFIGKVLKRRESENI